MGIPVRYFVALLYLSHLLIPSLCYISGYRSIKSTATRVSTVLEANSSIRSYNYKGFKLTYKYKPASKGYEKKNPLFLIHPVGVGMSSWFWNRYLETEGPAAYCPDLIGCGIQHGADPWKPDEQGIFIPLDWVRACEQLIQEVQPKAPFNILQQPYKFDVIVQGGLAPVGILLAHRNPTSVARLIMSSPPTWKDLTKPVPEKELAKNYNFLRSPLFGKYAFDFLESATNIRFFSNLFLFSKPCDDVWVRKCLQEACPEARPPVQAFNAGFCMARSYEEELKSIRQPVLVLSGRDDTKSRQQGRLEYAASMPKCSIETMEGKGVLPWEFPTQVAEAVGRFTR